MKINFALLRAIKEKGLRQKEFARLVHDDPSVVSRVINGQWVIDEYRKIKYAKALGKDSDDLFKD